MLVTLYGRALQSRLPDPVLPDRWAEEAVSRIDYDFAKLKISKVEMISIAVRARQFDLWTANFLADHPDATVLHLGCGMDSRVFRIDPPAGVRWYDVDYPDVIALRRRLYPKRNQYQLVGSSLAEMGWLDDVPGDRPAMVVAEGVTMYLTEDIMKPLLNGLASHFPGGQMAFDAYNLLTLRMTKNAGMKGTGAKFGWGIDDPQDIKRLDPRFELVTELRSRDLAAYGRLPASARAMVRVMDLFPALRNASRALLYRF